MAVDPKRLNELCEEAFESAIEVRRAMHRRPELSWNEHETQLLLDHTLGKMGIKARPVASTGLFADVGRGDAPVVYRADMDALPIHDGKDGDASPVHSEIDGISHACGHDLHCAVAVGIAKVMQGLGPKGDDVLDGRVRFVFQPAEEVIPSGAEAVIGEGAVKGARACLALHVDPMRQAGQLGLRAGPMTAAGDAWHLEIIGKGGHASRPYLSRDPVTVAGQLITALPALPRQLVNPLEPAVISVTMVHGGSASNVIPDRVKMSGTLRTFHETTRHQLQTAIRETARSYAARQGCEVDIRIDVGAPPLANDADLDARIRRIAVEVLGEQAVQEIPHPSTGSEDFSYFGTEAPTYMLRLGVGKPGVADPAHLHTAEFDPDESAIGVGIKVYTRVILDCLAGS